MEKRIINTELSSNEESVMENKLRPSRLTEYIGQDKVKNNLKVYIEAAKCSTDLRDLEKPHSPVLLQRKWG